MREIQTQEIADSELDNVAGGLVGNLAGTATHTVHGATGLNAGGTLGTATGTVEGLSGVNTAQVTGLVAGL